MTSRLVIARNILANWSGLAISTLVSFLLAPFILHKLGDAGYGVWMLALSLTGYLGLLDLGIRSSVVRYVAKYKASSDYKSLNELVNTGLVAYSLAGLLSLGIGLFLGLTSGSIFNIPVDLHSQAVWVILLISFSLALGFGTGVFASTLVGIERFDLLNIAVTLGNIVRAALVLVALPLEPTLAMLGLISVASSLVSFLLIIYFAFSREPNLRINFKLANPRTARTILNYGFFSFLIIIATRVSYYSDNTIIGIFGSAQEITYFAIGAIGLEFLRRVVNALTSVIMPVASGLEGQGSKESFARLLTLGAKYSFLIILPASVILLIMGKTLLGVWMGPQYAEKSFIILAVLLIPQIYSLSQFSTEEVLLGTARHRFFSVVVVAEALCNLILSIILIKPYGILGVAIGTSVPVVIFRVLFSPIFVRKITGYSFLKYLRESLLSPLALAIPIAIAAILLEKFLRAESLWEFFLQALLLILIYYLLAWRLVIEKSVKDSIQNRLKKLTVKVG
ncbi:MAG: hypothetical protein A2142_09165 [candidate division Zixibacteria bacterium RBG_16_48_11]|nr:MAG: hypothetical protein A2142_09165 [candidate division Zixibacteria bacterium RBG_16_48_11]